MPLKTLQQALIEVFSRWGQPHAIKVDNGRPFGEPGADTVPVLALWLIGLGIDVIWNRPAQPTDNAKVERMQAVTANWAEPERCADCKQLEAHLDEVAHLQRSRYRLRRLKQKTREEAYPGLCAGGRRYDGQGFDLERVLTFLARGTWVRRVSKVGQIDFYGQRWQVGAAYRRQQVWLRLDPVARHWLVSDEAGREIKRFDASFLSAASIEGVSLCQGTEVRQNSAA